MHFYIRKIAVCFFLSFILISCSKGKSTAEPLYLDNLYYYLPCEADSTYTEAIVSSDFKKLEEHSFHNLENLTAGNRSFIWIKADFSIPDKLKHKPLGYVIPYVHFAEKVWLNGTFIGEYGSFPPDIASAQYVSHFYFLPETLLNQDGKNTLLLKIFVPSKGSLSAKSFIAEAAETKRISSIFSFLYSRVYMLFEGGMFCTFFLFYLLFLSNRKIKEYMSFSLLNLFTLIFSTAFFAPEVPWYTDMRIPFLLFVKVIHGFSSYAIVFFFSSFIMHFVHLEESRNQLYIRLGIFSLASVITFAAPSYTALIKICPAMLCLSIVQLLFGLHTLIRALLRSDLRYNALVLLKCFALTAFTGIADIILHKVCKINLVPFLTLFGWQGTIIMFLYVLAARYSRMFNRNEYLNEKLELEVANQTKKLSQSKAELEAEIEKSNMDLEMASIVQQKFLPKSSRTFRGWDIAVAYKPLSAVSGDFYDYYDDDVNLTGLSLFDVSGHGISASLITMLAKSTVFRTFKKGCRNGESVSKILEKINELIIDEKGNVDNYLTGLLIKILPFTEDDSCTVELGNAGHPYPLLFSSDNSTVSDIMPSDLSRQYGAIGIKGIDVSFQSMTFNMKINDILLLYTDGLIETMNTRREQFGKERVKKIITDNHEKNSREIIEILFSELNAYKDGKPLDDDITVIVLKREPTAGYIEELDE